MSDYISIDTVAQILTFLPVKSVLRFRCVCKAWKQLIDSPLFIEEHLSLQKPRFLGKKVFCKLYYFVIDPHTSPSIDSLDVPDNEFSLVVGSHHGVVCLHDYDSNFMLWNPSIRKFSSVSVKTTKEEAQWDYSELIALEYGCYGFWIDPSSKEFKIILLCWMVDEDEPSEKLVGILYSSMRAYWRVIQTKELEIWMPPFGQSAVMIQEVAHWKQNQGYGAQSILSFDFVGERFEFIEVPQHLCFSRIQHWQGNLSLVRGESDFPGRFDMYTRQDALWVNKFRFDLVSPTPSFKVCWLLGERGGVRALALDDNEPVLYDTRAGIIPLKHDFPCGESGDHLFVC